MEEGSMISAQRVFEVAKFLEGGETWEQWVSYRDTYKLQVRATDGGFKVSLSALFKTNDGNYVHHIDYVFLWHDLERTNQTGEYRIGLIAFHLVQLETELFRNKI
jgi:hypothetical protein